MSRDEHEVAPRVLSRHRTAGREVIFSRSGGHATYRPSSRSGLAVFLDRDGVINENRADHVKSWDEFQFLPGAVDSIVRMSEAGARIFIITNQSIVNRGVVSRETVEFVNRRMVAIVESRGGRIAGVAYCPHRHEEACGCRKPQPGLLLRMAAEHGIDLGRSVLIGDALSDLMAGQAVGCRTILVLTGRGREQLRLARSEKCIGFAVAADLGEATHLILQDGTGVHRRLAAMEAAE